MAERVPPRIFIEGSPRTGVVIYTSRALSGAGYSGPTLLGTATLTEPDRRWHFRASLLRRLLNRVLR